uniref:Uncharacterized protein n=1 Tax=Plectus sambesii TaxID=2011161 RepID=A0A914V924_9BILA
MFPNPLSYTADIVGWPATIITSVILFLALLYNRGTKRFDYFKKKGVPYVEGAIPFVGNMLDFFAKGFTMDVERIKKYGRVYGEMQSTTPIWVIGDPSLVRDIGIKEFSNFVNHRRNFVVVNKEFSKALTMVEDAEWKGIRNVMTPTFSSAKMKKIVPLIQACSAEFVEQFECYVKDNKEFEVKAICGYYTMDVIARTQFSIEVNSSKEGDRNELIKNARRLFDSISLKKPAFWVGILFPFANGLLQKLNMGMMDNDSMKFFSRYVDHLFQLRTKEKGKQMDFLELLINAHDDELDDASKDSRISAVDDTTETIEAVKDWRVGKRALSKLEILSNAMLFFLAGYETTSGSMCWIFHELAYNPEAQDKLYEEIEETYEKYGSLTYDAVASMKYLDQVFCETTRLYPAAQRTDRRCNKACKIGDYTIEKDDMVNLAIYAIQRDPEYWSEPDEFRPERFAKENADKIVPYSYLAFGIGPRNCVGQRLAALEIKIGVAAVLRQFRFVPSENSERHPEFKKQGACTPVKGIFLRAERRI